jgi:GH25 family lysozyme M1 (1,4-beta-N-acetylmuramidase)
MSGISRPGMSAGATVTPLPGTASGIDVSGHNPEPDWASVRGAGVSFVAIKATEGDYYANGPSAGKPGYASEVMAAANAGLYVMPYAFANPYQGDAARNVAGHGSGTCQADYAWREISSVASPAYASSALMLPMVLDIEQDPYGTSAEPGSSACYGLSNPAMVTWIGQFLTEAKVVSGKTPVVYTNPGFWASCTGNATSFTLNGTTTLFGGYPLWIANYGVRSPRYPAAWSGPTFWQYTSGGTMPGVTGKVDLDSLTPLLQYSTVGTPVKPVRVRSLGELDGQAVTYSAPAGGLPPGLTISGTGSITGTPAAAGSYAVSVKAATASATSTVSFTWDVSGAITMAPQASRSVPIGTPVSAKVSVTDTNAGLRGYTAPVLTSSGLPPGLSLTRPGLISGWPSTTGDYRVRITATDGLGATATALFTWTVKIAADSGTPGHIRQQGGSGKCLDDPSSRITAGTAIDLASCTGAPNQAWTAVRDGSIRVLGRCLAASGIHVLLYPCDGSIADQWLPGSDGSLVDVRYGTCLNGPSGTVANGTRPILATCTNTTSTANQHWMRPLAPVVSGVASRCLDADGATPNGTAPNGTAPNDTAAVISACDDDSAQLWLPAANAQLAVQTGGCLTEGGTTAGSPATMARCANAASQHWKIVAAGRIAIEIQSTASGLCVTVPALTSGAGTHLVLGTCSTALTATWRAL